MNIKQALNLSSQPTHKPVSARKQMKVRELEEPKIEYGKMEEDVMLLANTAMDIEKSSSSNNGLQKEKAYIDNTSPDKLYRIGIQPN